MKITIKPVITSRHGHKCGCGNGSEQTRKGN